MTRKPIVKELINTRIASNYGGWIYCDCCGENIGYLCYVTYDNFKLDYQCKCGKHGKIYIAFGDIEDAKMTNNQLILIKNRMCCPVDQSPLFTILDKKLIFYRYEIECVRCNTKYVDKKRQ